MLGEGADHTQIRRRTTDVRPNNIISLRLHQLISEEEVRDSVVTGWVHQIRYTINQTQLKAKWFVADSTTSQN